MPRENTCLLCGARSNRCLPFPPQRTPQREEWLQALAMTNDELRPRGMNHVCRDHFADEDFDQDGNLCSHAIPQPMSPSSLLVGESNSEGLTKKTKAKETANPNDILVTDEERSDTRRADSYLSEPFIGHEDVRADLQPSPPSGLHLPAQAGTSGVSFRLGNAMGNVTGVKQEHQCFPVNLEPLSLPVKQEIKQEPYDGELTSENPESSSRAGEHAYARAAQSMPADSSYDGSNAACTSIPGSSSIGGVEGASTSFAGPSLPAGQDSLISSSSSDHDCPVCLQPFSHPVKLPCSHIFCFLCAKGFASQHGRCAFCRALIPPGYMDLPVLVPDDHQYRPNANVDSKYVWYYEGRNGWWQFEERHSDELEEAFQSGTVEHELQIAGFIYVIDIQRMVQFRKDRLTRTRRIKRDLFTAPRKGIAGLREDLINRSMI